MLRAENLQAEKVLTALEGLQLSSQELETAEKYLKGEAGEENLTGLTFRDLTQMSDKNKKDFQSLFESYFKKKRYDEAARLFNILFALGASTCCECFSYADTFQLCRLVQSGAMKVVRERALAVYVQGIECINSFISSHGLNAIINLADQNPQIVQQALKWYKGSYLNGRILLLTAYFYLRCSEEDLAAGASRQAKKEEESSVGGTRPVEAAAGSSEAAGGLLGGIKKLFGGKSQSGAAEQSSARAAGSIFRKQQEGSWPLNLGEALLNEEDKKLLEMYEDMFVESIGQIFQPDASADTTVGEIRSLLRQGQFQGRISESLLNGIRGRAVGETVFKLFGGCAFVNYMLSEKLRGVVMVCSAAAPEQMLNVMNAIDLRKTLERCGADLDELFGIPSREIVSWAAGIQVKYPHRNGAESDSLDQVLHAQFRKHPDAFVESYKQAGYNEAQVLAEIIRTEDKGIYRQVVLSRGNEQRDKVIDLLTSRVACPQQCRDYLEGSADLSTLYAIRTQLASKYYGGYNERNALEQYDQTYHDEAFYGRCMAYMAVRGSYVFFTNALFDNKGNLNRNRVQHTFQGLDGAGLGLPEQIEVMTLMVDNVYLESRKEAITQACIPIFQQYLAERTQEMVTAFAGAGAYGRYFALLVYSSEGQVRITEEKRESCNAAILEYARGTGAWQAQILSYTQDGSKLVKQKLEEILAVRPSWREQVTALLASKKAAERELGIRVLARWDTPEDREALKQLYEKEKNAKIIAVLDTVLGHAKASAEGEEESGSGAGSGSALSREDLVKTLHKGGKKRSLAWAYETPFSPVHRKSGETAGEEYLQALLLCYSSMPKPGVSPDGALLAEDLDAHELAIYVGELFDKWMNAGAEAKKRWVLYAASIHGGGDMVQKLHHQIQEWPQNARGAIAADAVQALALSPQPQALLIVDSIARKFKFKQVKAAAGQALEFAAGQLGLTREQLEDKIVPDLGFDEHMERKFDYGTRSFTVTVTPALEIEIYEENGKKLKNMPAPGAKDEKEKAEESYAAFKEMKKQMKATVTSQKQRLELALSAERLWTVEAWQELFVRNPIMHQFAIGLIWGIYEEHRLTRSFRYMEDGSFNTEDEEEYTLPQQGQIGLVHPIELSEESREAWKQQLEDYEIVQPIEQLSRKIYYRTEEEEKGNSLERFGGVVINDLSLGGKLTALGWYRGSVQDAGGFDTYYREDPSLGLGAELHFSGSFVGSGSMGGEEVTVYDVRFYKAGTIERGSYCYDEVRGDKQLPLKEIPERYFSEIIWQLAKATASSKERDESWKEERH